MLANRGRQERCALLAVSLGIFCVQLDSFALNLVLPDIGISMRATSGLQWTVSAYLLTVGALMLPAGKTSDLVGPKTLLTWGLCVFAAGSWLCGTAPTLPLLVGARVLQGTGAAVITPVGIALVTRVFPRQTRGRALGSALGVGGIATACGPFVGGVLTSYLSWRAVFWINVPICLAAAWWCHRCPGTPGTWSGDSRRRWVSSVGGTESALWGLISNSRYVALTAAGSAANAATVVFLFVIPLCLRTAWSLPTVAAGTAFLAPAVCMTVAGPLAGRVRASEAAAVMALCVSGAALAFWGIAWSTACFVAYVVSMTACGGALGFANALTLVATQAVVGPERAGVASGVTKTAVTVSGGLGMLLTGPVAEGAFRGSPLEASQDMLVWTAVLCCATAVFLSGFLLWQRRVAAG